MLSSQAKRMVLIGGVLISILTVFFLWFMNERLQVIGHIDDLDSESVLDETYDFHNEKSKVVAFIYTKCPDICPMTMYDLVLLQDSLKEENLFGTHVEIVTITLDPEFDTAQVLRQYASNFAIDKSGWFILRDSEDETRKIAKQFNMNYQKDENGFITHSTKLYLVDSKNRIRSIHDMNVGGKKVNIEEILNNIRKLLGE